MRNYRPDREPSRLTVILTGIIAALTVAALTAACVEQLAR